MLAEYIHSPEAQQFPVSSISYTGFSIYFPLLFFKPRLAASLPPDTNVPLFFFFPLKLQSFSLFGRAPEENPPSKSS